MSSTEQPPILVAAALKYELASISGAADSGLVLLETGEGVVNAERQLQSQLEKHSARAVLSIGFAGALSPTLQIGDLVIARNIRDSKSTPDARLLATAQTIQVGAPVHIGIAFTSHEVLWKAAYKGILAESLGANEIGFVDMESTAIAAVCAQRGVPFLIIRSISDLLEEDLPLDFNLYRNGDGRVDTRKVMIGALRRPTAFKGLFELRKRSKLCADRLAEFIKCLVPMVS